MIVAILIVHGLIATALLGAITHQAVAALRPVLRKGHGSSFVSRYAAMEPPVFRGAVIGMYVIGFSLGCLIYPGYRLDARIPLEEMQLSWAIGVFELKEHFGGIGLATLPLYAHYWHPMRVPGLGRLATTLLLAFITWFDFVSGHIINNIRGL